jgi:glycosyltransferase involved in cell wall biosynthesis
MKVAILMPRSTQRGGAEQLLDTLLQHTSTARANWQVIFFEGGPLEEKFSRMGVSTAIVRTGRLRHIPQYLRSIRQLKDLFLDWKPELVFSWMSKAHLYGGWAARWAGVPAMWYQHGVPDTKSIMDRLVTFVPTKGVLTCSKHAAEAQSRLWPPRPTRVVHPCVDLSRFNTENLATPVEVRRNLGLPEDGPLIGIVGRLQQWKGIHVFVESFSEVLNKYPNAHGVVVGGKHDLEPEYSDLLRRLILRLNLRDKITLAGFQENIPTWMQAMDVVVHASDHEPFGMVVIEAMALGKPVVAGAEGGPREIITDGVNGLLAPFGDANRLAQQILRYLDAPDFAASLGQSARQRALDFSPEEYARRFMASIREVLGGDSPSVLDQSPLKSQTA